jgi:hypothetical protein
MHHSHAPSGRFVSAPLPRLSPYPRGDCNSTRGRSFLRPANGPDSHTPTRQPNSICVAAPNKHNRLRVRSASLVSRMYMATTNAPAYQQLRLHINRLIWLKHNGQPPADSAFPPLNKGGYSNSHTPVPDLINYASLPLATRNTFPPTETSIISPLLSALSSSNEGRLIS